MRIGVAANYMRPPPSKPRREGAPYKDQETVEVTLKFRPGVQKGSMFICGPDIIWGEAAQIEATPYTLIHERNPYLAWDSGKRVIADLRRMNLYFDTSDVYTVELPTFRHLPNHIIALTRKSPQSNLFLTNRDTKSAFRLIRFGPPPI